MISEKFDIQKRSLIEESVDANSPNYWFAIQEAFAFVLSTTIHRFKVDFIRVL